MEWKFQGRKTGGKQTHRELSDVQATGTQGRPWDSTAAGVSLLLFHETAGEVLYSRTTSEQRDEPSEGYYS